MHSYNQTIQLNSKNDSSWFNKGIALSILQKYSEAIDWLLIAFIIKYSYNEAIKLNPMKDEAWIHKGYSLDN